MTTKELLYIEDALGHEKHFETECKETASKLQDETLRNCVEQLSTKHKELYDQFLNLL